MMPQWQHGADPMEMLQVDKLVEGFKLKLKNDPDFLKKKCKEYFKVGFVCMSLNAPLSCQAFVGNRALN